MHTFKRALQKHTFAAVRWHKIQIHILYVHICTYAYIQKSITKTHLCGCKFGRIRIQTLYTPPRCICIYVYVHIYMCIHIYKKALQKHVSAAASLGRIRIQIPRKRLHIRPQKSLTCLSTKEAYMSAKEAYMVRKRALRKYSSSLGRIPIQIQP